MSEHLVSACRHPAGWIRCCLQPQETRGTAGETGSSLAPRNHIRYSENIPKCFESIEGEVLLQTWLDGVAREGSESLLGREVALGPKPG